MDNNEFKRKKEKLAREAADYIQANGGIDAINAGTLFCSGCGDCWT